MPPVDDEATMNRYTKMCYHNFKDILGKKRTDYYDVKQWKPT